MTWRGIIPSQTIMRGGLWNPHTRNAHAHALSDEHMASRYPRPRYRRGECVLRASTYDLRKYHSLHTYMHANPFNPSTFHAGQLHDLAVETETHGIRGLTTTNPLGYHANK